METLTEIEKLAEKAENLSAFSGFKLLHVKKQIAQLLNLIGRNGVFSEYTKHDISHINQLLEITEWIIPQKTKSIMTKADWLMIVLSVYFHDLGMLVTQKEYENRNNTKFKEYKNNIISGSYGNEYKNKIRELEKEKQEKGEIFMYQEFVRQHHAERIKYWIKGDTKNEIGIDENVINELDKLLGNLPLKFKLDLGLICESHHLNDLDDFEKYKTSFPYGRSNDETVNIHYCALILRTVDLLHMTSDRTPSIEFRVLSPEDPISQIEWIKQAAVSNVRGKNRISKDGKPDESVEKDTIEVTAFYDKPEKSSAFFSLISYLNYVGKQLQQSYKWAEISKKEKGSQYSFPWKYIDDSNVQTYGFERELFQFNLDQNKILNLLVGHTLYNDSTVVLRELIQNSIDAIRLHQHSEDNSNQNNHKILIDWNPQTRMLHIIDTGVGMSRDVIKNHLLCVGSSRYQDENFKKAYPDFSPISRFGIGVLTCFLISNEIEITTISKDEGQPLNLTIKNVDGKYLLRNIEKEQTHQFIRSHGTHFSLKVRSEINMRTIENDIRRWILFPPCQVLLSTEAKKELPLGYSSPKEALENYLKDLEYKLDKNIKVVEVNKNGVTLAYALRYEPYFREWTFLEYYERNEHKTKMNPIGTCVEGIRVEFDSPGFKGKRIYAIANATGKFSPKTNVARSFIENSTEKSTYLKNIYDLYIEQVKNELKELHNKNGFSITWAVNETSHLLSAFLSNRSSDDKSEISNKDLLSESINEIDGLIIEQKKTRKAISANDLKKENEITIIDCNLFKSAEWMLKEVQTTASLFNLLEILYENKNSKFDENELILCGFDKRNILHINALENKEVVGIKIFHENRRIDLKWGKTEDKWIKLDSSSIKNRVFGPVRTEEILIQNKDIQIDGLKDEIAIGAFSKYYMLKGSYLHAYLQKLYESKNTYNTRAYDYCFNIIINLIIELLNSNQKEISLENLNTLTNRYLGASSENRMLESKSDFWNYIDNKEFIDIFLKTKWSLFDTSAWTRRTFDYMDMDDF